MGTWNATSQCGADGKRTGRDKARQILASFPEVPQVVNQIGRPDDGTDTTGFFDTEFFVDLLPKEKWRPVFHQNKERLIAAMDRELEEKIPGVTWGFSQPISDNLEEAVSGVKGALAVKIYGDDLKTLEAKADEIVATMQNIRGVEVQVRLSDDPKHANIPLGLLPAALSHGIGSDSKRPFAIVIVGGLIAGLIISIFLLPTLYAWFARSDDRLPEADPNEAV